jgi:wyosine [tRNA(Phe)-imidazoG37] synthetase (radical SAM superfamily)
VESVGFPSLSDLEVSIHKEFERLHQEGIAPDTIVFSGNGEPTLYPEFFRAVELVRLARNDYLPSSLLGILTNGTMLGEKVIFNAVAGLEIKCLKLDAGNLWMDRPCAPYSLDQLIPLWRDIPDLTIQSFFCEGQFDNTRKEWVELWIEQLKMIHPTRLQIYTLARQAPVSTMQKARAETLERIASRVREELSLDLQVFF